MISRFKKSLSIFLIFILLNGTTFFIEAGTDQLRNKDQTVVVHSEDSLKRSAETIPNDVPEKETVTKESKNESTSYSSMLSVNVILYLIYKTIFHTLD